MSKPKGFSLIELLVVIAIIGLLSTMAVVSLNNARVKSRDTRRMGDIKAIQTAIEVYKTQQSVDAVPTSTTWTGIGSSLSQYMTSLPSDPTNSGAVYTYVYCRYTAAGNETKYLLAGVLEQNIDVSGDLDTNFVAGTTGLWTCTKSNASAPVAGIAAATESGVPTSAINCGDSNGGTLSAGSQTVFCLGSM